MATITLELLTSLGQAYGAQHHIDLPLVNHVHKRLEHFAYLDDVKTHAVPLDYFETEAIDSKYILFICDRSYQIPDNASFRVDPRTAVDKVNTKSYSSSYSNILATNVTFIDVANQERPLFYKHVLPTETVSVELETIKDGNLLSGEDGYLVDLEAKAIYTNYLNYFDQETGNYKLHFVTTTAVDGKQTRTLLTPIPIAQEATWEDIDIDTGAIRTGNVVFTKERNTSGYTFYFNVDGPWWIRPQEQSLITCRYPIGRNSSNAWYPRVTNGDITAVINGASRRYHVPEYLTQPYQPSFPYIYSSYGDMLFVSSRVLSATRSSLAINPEDDRHITIYVSDFEDNLLRVWSTDTSLDGKRYSNTGVFYESGIILCWDNTSGMVVLSEDILPSWQFKASFFYSSDDLEYTKVNLNPVQNKELLKQTIVLYLVPNAGVDDSAVHHLVVEQNGVISFCSQTLSSSYPNLQLLNEDGSYNSGTVIGLKYISDIDADTFISRFGAGFDNDHGYMIIAEINVSDKSSLKDAFVCDVRRKGNSLVSKSGTIYYKNPKTIYSEYGYSIDGQRLPKNNVVITQVPLSLLKSYGGSLEEDRILEYCKKLFPAGTYSLVEWVYPYTEVSLSIFEKEQVTLSCSWEGGTYVYKIYRKFSLADKWELIHEAVPDAGEPLVFTDYGLESGKSVYYEVRLEDDYEFPAYNSFTVRIA